MELVRGRFIVSFVLTLAMAAAFAAAGCGEGESPPATATLTTLSTIGPTTAKPPTPTNTRSPASPSPAVRPSGAENRQQERANLPGVTAVEKWHEIAVAGRPENFAPSVVRLEDGRYRMYVNGGPGNGIVSYISSDGLTFAPEEGVRLAGGGTGALDCIASHPWVAAMDGGYRMYYQGDANCVQGDQSGQEHAFRIFSAFSEDGLSFKREGVRVDTGGTTGLRQAAHGRVLRLADGSYRMYFSADLAGKNGPADVLGATSSDGLTWTVNLQPILVGAHDPTVIAIDGTIYVYATFLGDNFVVAKSGDGATFTPASWLEFYNRSGTRIEEFGDTDINRLPDGRLALYGSGKGSKGVSVMVKE
jgi:hypothetical protein